MQQQEEAAVLGVRGVEADDFLKVERHGLEPIPAGDRHGTARELALVWTGAMANYVSLFTGSLLLSAQIGLGLGVLDSVIAIVVGAALAAILHGLVSVTGAKTGTPQMVFSRAVFGHRGAYLGAALTWLMAVGWFAVDCVIGGWALVQLLGYLGLPSTTTLALLCITLVLVASVIVAIYGHQTVHVFEKYGAIVFVAFCALLFVVCFGKINWTLPTPSTLSGGGRIAAMVLGGSFIYALVASWIPFASDYSRYLPQGTPARSIAWWSGLGIGLPTALLGILGVALLTIDPTNGDLLTVIRQAVPPWLAVPFLLFVVLGEIWANYFDVYTAGLVALAMDIPLRRWLSALICGAVAAVLVYWIGLISHFAEARTYADLVNNFLNGYVNFLLLTYLWVPAWAAVVLLDYFVFRKGRYHAASLTKRRAGAYWYHGGLRWQALVAWLLGLAAAIPFVDATLYQGPLSRLLGGADISGVVGAIVAGVLYFALERLTAQRAGAGQPVTETPAVAGSEE